MQNPAMSSAVPVLPGYPAFSRARAALPSQWLDSSPESSDDLSSAGSPPMPALPPYSVDDEIIPTAIVIKNIPFNVPRETLLSIMESLGISLPYAFNYHLDQTGAFRGLAFANFRHASDADAVVAALNGFDVQGRRLRVEYKKVLQASEKERIEREKAIRRMRSMQLEKEHQAQLNQLYDDFGPRFNPPFAFTTQPGLPSTPLPAVPQPSIHPVPERSPNELDMNDPSTLEIYSAVLLFRDDPMRDELTFSRSLTPKYRRIIQLVAQKLEVFYHSYGDGDDRHAVVTRTDPQKPSPKRTPALNRTPSAYLSPPSQVSVSASPLRVKKSMPDMKTLHSQVNRLYPRASNGNIREGYNTIASPTRRISTYNSLLSNGNLFGAGAVPPVPSLPSTISTTSLNGNTTETVNNVVRQPRGPGTPGFQRRDTRTNSGEAPVQARGVLDATTYEPLEI